jgi:UDP-glucose 4-epimerase
MTRVLVTGGAGFIGSTLVDRLVDEAHTVVVVDDLSTGKLANLERARDVAGDRLAFHQVDIATPDVAEVVAAGEPEVVLHLAAQIDVRHSVADPVHDAMVNVIGTVRLLEAARRAGVRKFVIATSGGTIYGEPPADALPVAEDFDGHPGSPYGASKRAVEEYLHTYSALYGLRWTALALSNVYGPRQNPEGEAGVVSIFGARMLAGQPLTVFGDGEQTRDFVFVDDVVDAFVRAMTSGDGLRCNIGTGEQISVNALFAELAGLTGYTREPEYAPARPGELQRIALDIRRAGRELGWKPRWSLAQGMAATLDWLRTTTA